MDVDANLISVVVPIYNREQTLQRCIKSLVHQTFPNIEILLVDDGSTDASLQICRNWGGLDSRIRVLHKENGGVSSARNLGIAAARGRWINFVDSDDYIHESMYERMLEPACGQEADVICCEMFFDFGGMLKRDGFVFEDGVMLKGTEIYNEIIVPLLTPLDERANQMQSAANKLYAASFLKEHGLCFDEQLSYAEDWMFNIRAFSVANRVYFVKEALYYYTQTSNGNLSRKWRPHIFDEEMYMNELLRAYVPRFFEGDDPYRSRLWSQSSALKHYVEHHGFSGFSKYAGELFGSPALREAYEKCGSLPDCFRVPRKAVDRNDSKCYVRWAKRYLMKDAVKYRLKRILPAMAVFRVKRFLGSLRGREA